MGHHYNINMIQTVQMLKLFGIICLIFVTGITISANENVSTESLCSPWIDNFITLSFDIENNSFIVELDALINSSCTLPDSILSYDHSCHKSKNFTFYTISDICVYRFATKMFSISERFNLEEYIEEQSIARLERRSKYILPGLYWINLEYTCPLNHVATFVFTYVQESAEKKFLILPRIPFPDWHSYLENATIKARFHIRIKHKITEGILSNMLVKDTQYINNWLYSIFHTASVLSFPMIAAVVVPEKFIEAKFLVFSMNTITLMSSRLQVTDGTSYAESIIRNITLIVRNKWKNILSSYVHYVALPVNSTHYENIVTTGFVLLREADIVYDKEIDSIKRRREVTCSVARSVIQEMFSNWLVPFEQDNSWFIDGLSTYYGVYIVDQISAESFLKDIVVQTRREFLDYTEAFLKYGYYESILHNSTFSKLWEIKAFSLFDMLFNILSNKPIQEVLMEEAVNVYYSTSNNSYDKQSHQNVSNIMRLPGMLNVTTNVITSWTRQVGYPIVQVTRNTDRQFVKIKVIDCVEIDNDEPCDRKWWIPLAYVTTKENIIPKETHINSNSTLTIKLPKEHFLILVNQTGYRVNYDRQTWKDIADFLKIIDSRSQFWSSYDITFAQILDDAFYFLVQISIYNDYTVQRNTDLDLFFDLARNLFEKNPSYITWYPMLTALEYMSKIFPFLESANVKDKISTILNTFFENTSHKHSSENSVSNQLYYEVLKWTCILDGLKCKEHVTAILGWHLDNKNNKLLPSWQNWIYCQSFIFENDIYQRTALLKLVNVYKLRKTDEYLPCFTYNIAESILLFAYNLYDPHLEYIRNTTSVAKVTHLFDMFAKHSKNVTSLDIIINELEHDILRIFDLRDVNLPAVLTFIINNIYSPQSLRKISGEWLLPKLQDIFNKKVANLVHDAIIEKVTWRKNFLFDMGMDITFRLHDVLYYKLRK